VHLVSFVVVVFSASFVILYFSPSVSELALSNKCYYFLFSK